MDKITDLGIIVDKHLCWNYHVDMLDKKAMCTLGLSKRTVGFKAPIIKEQLYTTLVRSIREYSVPAWSGLSKTNTVKIERFKGLPLVIFWIMSISLMRRG